MELDFNTRGNEKQKDCARAWLDNSITEIVYGGSKGAAKSFTGCSLIFGDAFIYPNTHYFIAREELNDLRKYTIPSIHEVFGLWGIPQSAYKYNGQDNYFLLYNNSKVFLIECKYYPSDPDYMRFGSMQMTRGWIEEAGQVREDAKKNLQASIGRWKNSEYGLTRKLLQTCNPSKNYLYGIYKKHKQGILEPHIKFIQALPEDNKMLPAGYLESLHQTFTGVQKQRLLFGNWEYDDSPDSLISYDNITNLFTNLQVRNENAEMFITADVARLGSDKAVISVWRGFEIVELIEYDISRINELQQGILTLKNKWNVKNSNILADEDGVGGGLVDILQIKGFINNSSPLPDPESEQTDQNGKELKENYQNLKSQCYFRYASRVSKGGVYLSYELSSTQKETIIEEHEQIRSYKTDMDGKLRIMPKEQVKANIGHSPDYSDCFAMREWFELAPRFRGMTIL